MPWFTVKAQANAALADISIYEPIGSWDLTAAQFIAQVKALGDVSQINLDINSPGGDVFEALTIFNFLKRHSAKVTVTVGGVAASAASLIAMAGDTIIMPNNTMMMIHNPWTWAAGNADELREQADMLDKIGGALFNTYQSRTGMDEEALKAMLATDTWLTADECLAHGFCDQVVDPITASAVFDVSKFPEQAQAVFAVAKQRKAQASIAEDHTPTDDEVLELLGDGTEPEPQAPETPLTDIDDDDHYLAQAEADALEYAATVVELCALASLPQKAAGFIKAKTSLTDVKASLLTAKANAQPALSTTQQPEKSWKSLSLTEKSRLLREDPALAKQLQSME